MNKSVPIEINSCGTYRLGIRDEMETCRLEGRVDYQLIYIASGRGYFYFDNSDEPTVVEAGNMVIYRPEEFQKYEYSGKDHANIYWIHFTGGGVGELFLKYGLDVNRNVISSGAEAFYSLTFDRIILELQLRNEFFEESAALLFSHVILTAGRYNREMSHNKLIPVNEVEDVMVYFRERYQENINVEDFLKGRGYGVSSFFRKFKKYTGMTPLQYLLQIRLSYAVKLLETTNFHINEISCFVGYDNALYFSRLFHKHMGMSPKEYRGTVQKNCKRNGYEHI